VIRERLDDVLVSPATVGNLGSIPDRYNEGNGGTVYYHDTVTGETVNSIGLASLGIDALKPVITEYSQKFADVGKTLIVGATTLRGQDATVVLPELMEQIFEAGAQRAEANYSCPNIVLLGGGRKPILGYDPEAVFETRKAIVARIGSDVKWQEKLPPYVGENAYLMTEVAGLYVPNKRLGRVGVTGFNTIPNVILERGGKPVLRIEAEIDGEVVVSNAGGLSGPVVFDSYAQLQQDFLALLPEDVPFIAAGGVWSGESVLARKSDERVVAVTGVSRFWEGENAGQSFGRTATRMAEEISEALEN
ncbi:MAG TPA: hypothetical protein VLF87_03755, partial [Patescibacteria group bacterium]|nr:hypothetical protein [Patescibacteria group bacterium]